MALSSRHLVDRSAWTLATTFAILVAALIVAGGAGTAGHGSTPTMSGTVVAEKMGGFGPSDPTTLSSPSAESGEGFGDSVAVSGPYVVVGAPFERADGDAQAGHAWVFNMNTGAVTKLTSPNAQKYGHFGFSVAVSGSTVLVGAPLEAASGSAGAGNAYTFNAATGALIASYSSPSIESSEAFGWSVALSGTTAVIGAPLEAASGDASAGHAWIFNTTSGSSIKLTSLNPVADGEFGFSVAVDASAVIVSADAETSDGVPQAGNVYSFAPSSGNLLAWFGNPDPQEQSFFGHSVAVHGTTVLVGAPGEVVSGNIGAGQAFTFGALSASEIATYTSPSVESNESFGYAVAINGTRAIIAAPFETSEGVAEAGHAWDFVIKTGVATKLSSPNGVTDGFFGWSLAVAGKTLVIGAPGETASGDADAGHAYIY